MLAFFELAASPQMFHVAIRHDPEALGVNSMCTGKTLFVGCAFALVSPVSDDFAFFVALKGPESDSSPVVVALRFEDDAACFSAGLFVVLVVTVAVSGGSSGRGDGGITDVDEARFRAISVCMKPSLWVFWKFLAVEKGARRRKRNIFAVEVRNNAAAIYRRR